MLKNEHFFWYNIRNTLYIFRGGWIKKLSLIVKCLWRSTKLALKLAISSAVALNVDINPKEEAQRINAS
jgi:hypothetical protein